MLNQRENNMILNIAIYMNNPLTISRALLNMAR